MPSHTPTQTSDPRLALHALLDGVHLGPAQEHKLLRLHPLLRRPEAAHDASRDYLLLSTALERGLAEVTEAPGGASVPHVLVDNRSDHTLLVLFGQALEGGLQTRVANASFVVPARTRMQIDVSCIEAGRWHGRRRFDAAVGLVAHRIRQRIHRRVTESRKVVGGFRSDQGEIWDDVQARLADACVASDTSSYGDYARSRQSDLEEMRRAFRVRPEQVGFVASIGGEVVGGELVATPELFREAMGRLLEGYAVDAVDAAHVEADAERPDRVARIDEPEVFLEMLRRADVDEGPSLGEGRDWRISGPAVEGAAVVADEVVHLAAWPREPGDAERRGRRRAEWSDVLDF